MWYVESVGWGAAVNRHDFVICVCPEVVSVEDLVVGRGCSPAVSGVIYVSAYTDCVDLCRCVVSV